VALASTILRIADYCQRAQDRRPPLPAVLAGAHEHGRVMPETEMFEVSDYDEISKRSGSRTSGRGGSESGSARAACLRRVFDGRSTFAGQAVVSAGVS